MITWKTLTQMATVAVAVVGLSAPVFAQQQTGTTALALGYVGGVSDGGGTTFGGGMHFPLGSRLVLAAEAGYLTGGQDFSGFGLDVDVHAIAVDANLHYQFPIAENQRFIPYALGGVGYLRASSSVSAGGFEAGSSSSTTGVNIGGGALWNVGAKWAVRPELKILLADGSNTRFSAALCYRFGN
jgi:opacity protein-like surface antigen